tara:strand:+ start:376 stop:528 length:153 start_codon:yes stop_codon:yes gene_type:complete
LADTKERGFRPNESGVVQRKHFWVKIAGSYRKKYEFWEDDRISKTPKEWE